MYKKGDISMTYIVVAALALVALIVIILFFTGGMSKLIKGQTEVIAGTVPDWQIQAWSTRCKFACTSNNIKDYCTTPFKFDKDEDGSADAYYTCSGSNKNIDDEDIKIKVGGTERTLSDEGGLGAECDSIKCK